MKSNQLELKISPEEFLIKLKKIRVWLFDWDGIFNDGHKSHEGSNTFSERDSMGTNMLRFAHYLRTDQQAYVAIITGATNITPRIFAEREHFHAIVPGALYKRDVVESLINKWNVNADEVGFFFDDILDLNVCEIAGLRVQVRYAATPILNKFIDDRHLADIVCHTSGAHQAVRQVCEYIIDQLGLTNEVITGRMHFSNPYQEYFSSRQLIETKFISRAELLNID
jgi:3-deoxy-D-manno-octulosonate 8-phosphate phosphatase (KDO 8-P phosphatase)